jgi:hypothetical protein
MNTLFTFQKFPKSICSQDTPLSDNEQLIEANIVEYEDGSIHFLPYIDPKEIYLNQHNNCVGEIWKQHYIEFSNFVSKYEKQNIVEIAGGNGNIFLNFKENNPNYKSWKIIDINPTSNYEGDDRVNVVKGFYEPSFVNSNEVVISSHFVEHVFDLEIFLKELSNRNPKYHIFSLPNFKSFSSKNYTATIMFEHPNYLPEDYLEFILDKNGWEIVDKYYYKEHSIFYVTQPTTIKNTILKFNNKSDIINMINYIKNRVEDIKDKKFYVFGAHLTYYYLLNLGIKEEQIIAVVDNDSKKQNKRMYGTNTKIISSLDLPTNADVFLEMGPYNEEIKKSISNVNFI